jgi:hypothetical protein
MASLYARGDVLWIHFKDPSGKWRNISTGYRRSNSGERRQAERLRDQQTLKERIARPTAASAGDWSWVDLWIETTWGSLDNTTPALYRSQWRTLQRWLSELDLPSPRNVTREHCLNYPQWRAKHGGARNTAILELKLLAQILDEAVTRGYVLTNVARKLGIKRSAAKEKRAWTEKELAKVDAELKRRDRLGWMRVTFLLGRYQAARLRQCVVALEDIQLDREPPTIFYQSPKGGSERAFSQPIDKRLLDDLREIVKHRESTGATTLCDLPTLPSLEWRRFLDELGIHGVSHHALRVTWVTRAAMRGIPESVAQRFSNHASTEVHRIYQRFTSADMAKMLERLT